MRLPWEVDTDRFEAVAAAIESYPGRLVGDVGFYYLPYVEMLIDRFSNVRFVCLKRGRSQVVRSYMAKTGRRNPWSDESHREGHATGDWWQCYPQYALPKEAALNRYYTHYYRRASGLRRRYPDRFKIWRVDSALNTQAGQIDVLQHAGLRKQRTMVFHVGVQVNRLLTRRGKNV